MSAPPLEPPTPAAGPRSAVSAFDRACARRDIASLQAAIAGMSKREAVEHLAGLFPWRTERWFIRNLEKLTAIDPDIFWRLMHPDPTGERAVRNVMLATA